MIFKSGNDMEHRAVILMTVIVFLDRSII